MKNFLSEILNRVCATHIVSNKVILGRHWTMKIILMLKWRKKCYEEFDYFPMYAYTGYIFPVLVDLYAHCDSSKSKCTKYSCIEA